MVDRVVLSSEEHTPAPEGHDQAMIDAANGAVPPKPPVPDDTPKLYAGKYKTVEEMEAGYQELQSRFSKGETPPEEAPPADPEAPEVPTDEVVEEELAGVGLNLTDMSARYEESGVLPEEDYAALEKAGITKDVVDEYIAGKQALVDAQFNSITSEVGGTDTYNEMVAWAGETLDDGQIDAFNKAVDGDLNTARLAVQGLKAQYEAANGSEPRLRDGDTTNTGSTDVYQSHAQLQADMRTQAYKTDPAFRSKVEQKLSRSSIM